MSIETVTFNPTSTTIGEGEEQEFVVPAGVTSIDVDVRGGKGGNRTTSRYGGKGGRVVATVSVTPGDTLYIHVGQRGANNQELDFPVPGGYNGGGDGASGSSLGTGGGSSDIRTSSGLASENLSSRIVVAGGGGSVSGGTSNGYRGGAGGGLTGGTGLLGTNPGTGGTQSAGGTANGALWKGGTPTGTAAAAGGGGYYGGGGGYGTNGAGGGGSSYTDSTLCTDVTHTQGYQDGNGVVIITYEEPTGVIHEVTGAISASVTTASPATAILGARLDTTGTNTTVAYVTGRLPVWANISATASVAPAATTEAVSIAFASMTTTTGPKAVRLMPGKMSVSAVVSTTPKTWAVLPRSGFETLPLIGRKGRSVRDSGEAAPIVVVRMGPERTTREGLGE